MIQLGKLIKKNPGSRLLISSLPGSASRAHIESLSSLTMSTSVLKAFLVNFFSPCILYWLSSSHIYLCLEIVRSSVAWWYENAKQCINAIFLKRLFSNLSSVRPAIGNMSSMQFAESLPVLNEIKNND